MQTVKVAEFIRPTAGFGTQNDRRVLFQVTRPGAYRRPIENHMRAGNTTLP